MSLRTTDDQDRSLELRDAIDHTGYYPEVVIDSVSAAVSGERVVSFYVHHEPTFDRDEVRRHLSVMVLTPSRLIIVHTDEHAGDDLLPEPYTSTSSEAIRLSSVTSVVVTRMVANPASVSKVALVRLGAVTHSDNMEQRYIPLSFTAGATSLTATAPSNANIAPPGPYMLFILDTNGVPSIAHMLSLQSNSPPATALTQPANGATFTAPATVNLSATATDTDGSVTKVEFFNGPTRLGEDSTDPYAFTWSGVTAGTYTLTARATDNSGDTTTSTSSTITVNPTSNTPPNVTVTSPADGAIFAWKPTIAVTATASDPNSSVSPNSRVFMSTPVVVWCGLATA